MLHLHSVYCFRSPDYDSCAMTPVRSQREVRWVLEQSNAYLKRSFDLSQNHLLTYHQSVKRLIMPSLAILCVDDEKVILESLKEQLKRRFGNQYLYEVAESAEEAWEIIEELHSEEVQVLIIVSDWLMPDMKGDEFLIQVHQKFPSIIKVMLTGQADEAAIERAQKEANLYYCLRKPWAEDELARIIISTSG